MHQLSVRKLARFVSIHPNWSLLITLILTILALWKAKDLQIEMDVADLLPDDLEVVKISQAAYNDMGSFDFMLAVVEVPDSGDREMLISAAEELAHALDDGVFINNVTYRIDPATLQLDSKEGKARAVSLLTTEDWDVLTEKLSPAEIEKSIVRLRSLLNAIPSARYESVLQDPLNFSSVIAERTEIKSGPLKVNLLDNYFISEDGNMLLMIAWPTQPSTDLGFARIFKDFLEQTKEGIYIRNPKFSGTGDKPRVDISYYGPHYEAITDSELLSKDFYKTSFYSFLAVVLLFIIAFRRPEALLFVVVPLVIGVTWTLGFSSLLVGRLTQVTIAFAAILIGLGIDFSVHLYNRYIEEQREGQSGKDSLRAAVAETGPGIIVGAATTAIAFFGLMITRFEGFRELGLIAGVGIISCLVAVLLVLPPMLSIMGSIRKIGEFTQRPMVEFGLNRFYHTATAYPRMTVILILMVTVYLGYFAQSIGFEDDFTKLQQPTEEYVELKDRISKHFDVPANQLLVIVRGDTLQEALERNDQLFNRIQDLEAIYPVIAVDSMRYFIPSFQSQIDSLERISSQSFDVAQIEATIDRVAQENNLSPAIFDNFISQLREFQEAAEEVLTTENYPIDMEKLDRNDEGEEGARSKISQRYAYKTDTEWRIFTQIYPPATEEWQGQVPEVYLDTLKLELEDKIDVTGTSIIQSQLRKIIVKDLALAVLVILLLITVLLVIWFQSFLRALFAIIPVFIGILSTLGIMSIIGMELHYLNIIALPMIVGIGVDSGIHLIQRYYENDERDLRSTIVGTGRAVVITSLTTIFGFGSLALANYQAIRDLGIVSIIGVGTTLIASLVLVPCLLSLTQKFVVVHGGGGDEIG